MKRNLLIGTLVSGVFLFLALRGIEWDVLWTVLKQTRVWYVLPAIGTNLLSCYFRAYRWKFMLLPLKSIKVGSLFSATMIGLMANNLLPARLGEIVRAYVVGQREQISRTGSFTTIVYERIVDVFTLLVLVWLMFTQVPAPEWLRRTALSLLAANVLLMIAMLAMERQRGLVSRLAERISRRFSAGMQARIKRATEGHLTALTGMIRPKTLLPIAVLSVPVLLFAIVGVWCCIAALDVRVPFVASLTLVVFIAMGSMIPSAPAYLGTTQYACIVGLGLFGIGKSEALAFSILFHAVQFLPVTAVGLYLLGRSHIRLRDIPERREINGQTAAFEPRTAAGVRARSPETTETSSRKTD